MIRPDFFSLSYWLAYLSRRRVPGFFTRAYSARLTLTNPSAVLKIRPQEDYYFVPLFVMASWTPGANFAGAFNLRITDDNLRMPLQSQKNPRHNDTGIPLTDISTPAAGASVRYLVPVEYVVRGLESLILEISGYTPGGAGLPPNIHVTVWGVNQPVTASARVRLPKRAAP